MQNVAIQPTWQICHSERSEESGLLHGQRRSFAPLRMTTSHLKPVEPEFRSRMFRGPIARAGWRAVALRSSWSACSFPGKQRVERCCIARPAGRRGFRRTRPRRTIANCPVARPARDDRDLRRSNSMAENNLSILPCLSFNPRRGKIQIWPPWCVGRVRSGHVEWIKINCSLRLPMRQSPAPEPDRKG